ncbi:hypothetical protein Lfu02_04850 [Longispora fulva]|uniref:Phage host-nuclease inhibitor protein Gam n=1 Tax=Longispora fulva TaxID=619741 RepID=A0A8J7G8H6_9ACTN|nr:polymorphic toxin-type HINT domain-containing protein [Longispora fulva]MBG6135648.1 phage host-nuclease inhibitor protein Gam [Longispora fulva]GIG56113.1 hypothetical protein Lfu02_04850 [Longispora fulva]
MRSTRADRPTPQTEAERPPAARRPASHWHLLQRLAGNTAVTGLLDGGPSPHLTAAPTPPDPRHPTPRPATQAPPTPLPPPPRPERSPVAAPTRPPRPPAPDVDSAPLLEDARQAAGAAGEREAQARADFQTAAADARSAVTALPAPAEPPQARNAAARALVQAVLAAGTAGTARLGAASGAAIAAIGETTQAEAGQIGQAARQQVERVDEHTRQAHDQVTAGGRAQAAALRAGQAAAGGRLGKWRQGEKDRVSTAVATHAGDIRAAGAESRAQIAAGAEAAVTSATAALSSGADRAGQLGGAGGSEPVDKGKAQVADRASGDARDQLRRASGEATAGLRGRAAESDREVSRGTDRMAAQVEAELPGATSTIDGAATDTSTEVGRTTTEATASVAEHVTRASGQISRAGSAAATAASTRATLDRAQLLDAGAQAATALRTRVAEAAAAAHDQITEIAGQAAAIPLDERAAAAATGEVQTVIGAEFDTAATGLARVSDAVGGELAGAAGQSRAALAEAPARAAGVLSRAAAMTVGDLADGTARVTSGVEAMVSGTTTGGTAAVTAAGQRLTDAAGEARTGLTAAAGTARQDLAAPAEQTRVNTEEALAGVGERISRGQQQVADRGSAVQRTAQRVVQRSILGSIGDWFARQWDDIKEMLGNWGFWAGLLVTLVLFPFIGPAALVVGGAVGGAVSGIQQNVKSGRDWYDWRNITRGALIGAAAGAAFALGGVALAAFGLEGAALVAGEMVLAGGIGAIINVVNGEPWDKGLLGNIMLVGLFRGMGKLFPGLFGGGRVPVEEGAPGGGRPPVEEGDPVPVPDELPEGCFVPGTLVLTPDGPVPIERLVPGDKVIGAEPGGEPGPRLVAAVMAHTVPWVLDLSVAGQVIGCSPEHPFWVEGVGWTPAGRLTADCVLITAGGQAVPLAKVAPRPRGSWRVHNLTVAGSHTYFVTEAAVLVHNKARRARPPSADLQAAKAGEVAELESLKTRARQARQGAEELPEDTPNRDAAVRELRDIEHELRELQVDADGAQSTESLGETTAARGQIEGRVAELEGQLPRRPQPVEQPPPGRQAAETYPTVEAAIGQVEGRAQVVQTVETANPDLRAQGFTKTVYVVDSNGTQWTVHHNPRTGRFFGAHHSSSN